MDGNFSPQPATSNSVPSFNLLDNVRAAVVETKFEVANVNGLTVYKSSFKLGQLGRFECSLFFEELKNMTGTYNFGFGLKGERHVTPLLGLHEDEQKEFGTRTENAFLEFARLHPNARVEVGGTDARYSIGEYEKFSGLLKSEYSKLVGESVEGVDGLKVEFAKEFVTITKGGESKQFYLDKDFDELVYILKRDSGPMDKIRHFILNIVSSSKSTTENKMYQRTLLYYEFLKEKFGSAVEKVKSEAEGKKRKYIFEKDEKGYYFMVDMSKIAAKSL